MGGAQHPAQTPPWWEVPRTSRLQRSPSPSQNPKYATAQGVDARTAPPPVQQTSTGSAYTLTELNVRTDASLDTTYIVLTADEYVMCDVTERVGARSTHLARVIAAVFQR